MTSIYTAIPPIFIAQTQNIASSAEQTAQQKLDALYDDIASDIKQGKPLVISTSLVLWDSSFGEGEGKAWANGSNPDTNLYWGARYGLYTMLKNSRDWKEVYSSDANDNHAMRKVVFERTVQPNRFWRQHGVTRPFKAYVVIDMFKAVNISQGYDNYARNLYGNQGEKIALNNGITIEAGGKSRIAVMSGHMMPIIGQASLSQYQSALNNDFRKGTAIFTCLSATVFGRFSVNKNITGMLYTKTLFAPEGYVHTEFYNSIIEGKNASSIVKSNNDIYKKYQNIPNSPAQIFTNEDSF